MYPVRWFQITPGQYRTLHYLLIHGTCCMGDLATALKVSAPAVAKTARVLERKGLIRRREDASDRRRVLVSLSDAGRKAAERAQKDRREAS